MFFFFAVSVNWILINVMLTIIIEGYERVKEELEGKKNDLDVLEYIRDCALSAMGKRERPHFMHEFSPEGFDHGDLVIDKIEEDGVNEECSRNEEVVNELPNKIDEFLKVITKFNSVHDFLFLVSQQNIP